MKNKTLHEIKEEIAQEMTFENWDHLVKDSTEDGVDHRCSIAAERYAHEAYNQALEDACGKLELADFETLPYSFREERDEQVGLLQELIITLKK